MRSRLAIAAALLALLAGCGGGEEAAPTAEEVEGTVPTETETRTETGAAPTEGDPQAGKAVFAEAGCGGCHTLAAANASGTVGPSLDDSQPEFSLVVDRVTNGRGAMPSFKDQLSEKEINDVAAYVVDSTSS
jgi:mono/diheme cytochrome c family protein